MKINVIAKTFGIGALAILAACSGNKGWSVSGTIEEPIEGVKLAVDGFGPMGQWYNIDSVEVASSGKFKYRAETGSVYPDVYRLSYNGKSIFFPVDSLDDVTVDAKATAFDTDYELGGTPLAVELMQIDKLIAEAAAQGDASANTELKRQLATIALSDSVGINSYYLINKTVAGKPIFSDTDKADLRVIGAVANKFTNLRPNDPRTSFLKQRFLQARAALGITSPNTTVVEVPEMGLIEIELYDVNGKKHSLAQMAKDKNITLLSFTSYTMDNSTAYNMELNKMFEKYAANGIGIYQVAFDSDESLWAKSAANMPWTAVRFDPLKGESLLRMYNVGALPLTFVIDGKGDIVERVANPTQLDAAIRKHI